MAGTKRKKTMKAAGRYNISVYCDAHHNKNGYLSPFFAVSNRKKDKDSGDWVDQKWYYLEDLYALQAQISRAIAYGESLASQPKSETPASSVPTQSTIETTPYDDDDIPF